MQLAKLVTMHVGHNLQADRISPESSHNLVSSLNYNSSLARVARLFPLNNKTQYNDRTGGGMGLAGQTRYVLELQFFYFQEVTESRHFMYTLFLW